MVYDRTDLPRQLGLGSVSSNGSISHTATPPYHALGVLALMVWCDVRRLHTLFEPKWKWLLTQSQECYWLPNGVGVRQYLLFDHWHESSERIHGNSWAKLIYFTSPYVWGSSSEIDNSWPKHQSGLQTHFPPPFIALGMVGQLGWRHFSLLVLVLWNAQLLLKHLTEFKHLQDP